MAITVMFDTDGVTLDETSGLQFLNSPDNTVAATDNDDNDVARTMLPPSFSERLFVDLGLPTAFPDLVGVATGTIATQRQRRSDHRRGIRFYGRRFERLLRLG
jgi:hypothetical protein